jgi:hypothetical protein
VARSRHSRTGHERGLSGPRLPGRGSLPRHAGRADPRPGRRGHHRDRGRPPRPHVGGMRKSTWVLNSAQWWPSWIRVGSGASRPSAGGWGERRSGVSLGSPLGAGACSGRGVGVGAGSGGEAPVSWGVGDAVAADGTGVVRWSLASVIVRVATSTPAIATTRPIAISSAECLRSAVRGGVPGAGARAVKVVVIVLTSRGSGKCEHH